MNLKENVFEGLRSIKSNLLRTIRLFQDSVPEHAFTWGSVPGYGGSSGSSSASGRIGFVPLDERKRSQTEIVNDLNKKLKKFKLPLKSPQRYNKQHENRDSIIQS
jgi:hypothetical protein